MKLLPFILSITIKAEVCGGRVPRVTQWLQQYLFVAGYFSVASICRVQFILPDCVAGTTQHIAMVAGLLSYFYTFVTVF